MSFNEPASPSIVDYYSFSEVMWTYGLVFIAKPFKI